ncbi:hypothetical protein [Agrobacterium vitis]|uniref:hypothetical protein n=1 Tax=Agrobacterium vitis TaxID=373 RepID=UPI003D2A7452
MTLTAGGISNAKFSLNSWLPDRRRKVAWATNIFWFLVFVSWLPIVAAVQELLISFKSDTHFQAFSVEPRMLYFVLIALGILAAGLAARVARRPAVLIVCVLPALVSVLMNPEGLVGGPLEGHKDAFLYFGIGAVILSAACFVATFHLRSPAVAAFLLLAAIEAFSGFFPVGGVGPDLATPEPTTPGSVILTFGHLFTAYNLSILDLLISCSLIVLARFVFLLWDQNRTSWSDVRSVLSWSVVGQATWLAVPFFIVIFALSWFWSGVSSRSENYAIETLTTEGQPLPGSLQEALTQASARERAEMVVHSKQRIEAARADITAGTGEMLATMAKLRASFPDRIMQPSDCRWYDVFCHVVNGMKSVANSIYRKARDAALNAFQARLERIDRDVNLSAEQKRELALVAIDDLQARSGTWSDTAIAKSFQTADWLSTLMSIYGFMIAVKTVMVILSRIIYRDEHGNKLFASIRSNSVHTAGSVPEVKNLEIDLPSVSDLYIALRYEVRNAVANISIPQPTKGIISRILTGRYVLGKLHKESLGKNKASIVVPPPFGLVAWNLEDREEIIIHYGDIVAFSKTVRLATEFNFSLQATLFGRFVFHKAVGPGMVVIQTQGGAVAGKQKDADESRRASSLKAWVPEAGFQIQSNLNWLGVYLAPYNIRKQPKAMLVYDAGPKNAYWSAIGLIKAVRTFLLPF